MSALLVFVAVDGALKPTPVPPLTLDSDAVRASQAAAEKRRAARLAREA